MCTTEAEKPGPKVSDQPIWFSCFGLNLSDLGAAASS